MLKGLALVALIAMPGTALAQSAQCSPPAQIARPDLEGPTAKEPRRILPIGSYTLALSWSPEYCRTRETSTGDAMQCSGQNGRFGFTVPGDRVHSAAEAVQGFCGRVPDRRWTHAAGGKGVQFRGELQGFQGRAQIGQGG